VQLSETESEPVARRRELQTLYLTPCSRQDFRLGEPDRRSLFVSQGDDEVKLASSPASGGTRSGGTVVASDSGDVVTAAPRSCDRLCGGTLREMVRCRGAGGAPESSLCCVHPLERRRTEEAACNQGPIDGSQERSSDLHGFTSFPVRYRYLRACIKSRNVLEPAPLARSGDDVTQGYTGMDGATTSSSQKKATPIQRTTWPCGKGKFSSDSTVAGC
jgi:hypothetical protein